MFSDSGSDYESECDPDKAYPPVSNPGPQGASSVHIQQSERDSAAAVFPQGAEADVYSSELDSEFDPDAAFSLAVSDAGTDSECDPDLAYSQAPAVIPGPFTAASFSPIPEEDLEATESE